MHLASIDLKTRKLAFLSMNSSVLHGVSLRDLYNLSLYLIDLRIPFVLVFFVLHVWARL